jgi:hypothetical protein
MDAYITEKGSLAVSGIAWSEGAEPPYLTDNAHLSLLRVNEMSYYVQWTDVISAEDYVLQEATEPNFGSLTLNESVDDTSYLVSKVAGEEGVYYYRVQGVALDTEPRASRWSNVASATVPWSESTADASASPLAATGAAADGATVQVRTGEAGVIEGSEWYSAEVTAKSWGWTWSYDWPLPQVESTPYLIQSRASEDGESFGPVDTITVTLDNRNYLMYLSLMLKRSPPIPSAPSLDPIENLDKWVNYQVSWSYDDDAPGIPDPTSYTLQEAKDPAFTNPTNYYPGSAQYYNVSDPAREKTGGTYYYRVRGHNAYGPGQWSNVVSTQLRVLPYAPQTLSVDDPNQDGDITVNWTYGYDYPPATSYTLQEAMDQNFTVDVQNYSVAGTSKELGDRKDGTYYRVRAHNDYGPGDWSDSISIVVETGYRDDFDDPDSGWEARRTSAPDIDDMDVKYKNGRLITISDDRYDFGIFSPMVKAPELPYEIGMRTRVIHEAGMYAPSYGIVFGAEAGDFCPVERDNAEDNDGCFYHYYRLNVPVNVWAGTIQYGVKRIDKHVDRGKADGKDLTDGYRGIDNVADWDGWNEWKIKVYEDEFKVYVNGEHLGTFNHDRYEGDPLFGILTDNYESAPAKFEHDYFYVETID